MTFAQNNVLKVAEIQERILHGTVTDEKSGSPIIYADVLVDKTTRTCRTNSEGKYFINALPSDTLIFRYIGYRPQKVRADKLEINIELIEDGPAETIIPRKPFNKHAKVKEAIQIVTKNEIQISKLSGSQGIKGFPSEYKIYLESPTFLELRKKSLRKQDKEKNIQYEFKGFRNWKTQECEFLKTETTGKRPDNYTITSYYFKNQHLLYKDISFYKSRNFQKSIAVFFYESGEIKGVRDFERVWHFDPNGKLIKTPFLADEKVPHEDIAGLKLDIKQLKELRTKVGKLSMKYEHNKYFEDYSIRDWKIANKIRDYIKSKLSIDTDLYFNGMNYDTLSLISEHGDFYDIWKLKIYKLNID